MYRILSHFTEFDKCTYNFSQIVSRANFSLLLSPFISYYLEEKATLLPIWNSNTFHPNNSSTICSITFYLINWSTKSNISSLAVVIVLSVVLWHEMICQNPYEAELSSQISTHSYAFFFFFFKDLHIGFPLPGCTTKHLQNVGPVLTRFL